MERSTKAIRSAPLADEHQDGVNGDLYRFLDAAKDDSTPLVERK